MKTWERESPPPVKATEMMKRPLMIRRSMILPLLVALTFAAWDAQGSASDRGTLGSAAR